MENPETSNTKKPRKGKATDTKERTHQKRQWTLYAEHDVSANTSDHLVFLRELRPDNKFRYPDFRVHLVRARETEVERELTETELYEVIEFTHTKDEIEAMSEEDLVALKEKLAKEHVKVEKRTSVVHSGKLDVDAIRASDIDAMKLYDVLVAIKAAEADAMASFKSRQRGAHVKHGMKFPEGLRDTLPKEHKKVLKTAPATHPPTPAPAPPTVEYVPGSLAAMYYGR